MTSQSLHPGSVTIVGAGQAGGWVAATLRSEGFGGAITLVGEESHPPYERPPLSKDGLIGAIPVEQTYLKPLSFYEDAAIALRMGEGVAAIDRDARRLHLSGGETLPYDLLVLATGSRPRRLALPGADSSRIHYLRDIADMLRLKARLLPGRSLAVVGGGFIGMEIAASAAHLGVATTVVEQAPSLMARVLPSVVSEHLAGLHRAKGVRIHCGARVLGFTEAGRQIAVELDGGLSVLADEVVVGVGAIPNVELASAADLVVDDGVVVDAFGRTSDPDIRAVGDVTRHFNPLLGRYVRLESWQNAQNQAIAVARAILGGDQPYAEPPWLWSDQYDANLQVAGLPGPDARIVLRGEPGEGHFSAFAIEHDRLTGAFTVNQPRDMRPARQLIASGMAVSAAQLADPRVPLQSLLKQAA